MTGMLCAASMMAAGGRLLAAMTVDSATIPFAPPTNIYVDGFSAIFSIGTLTPVVVRGATVRDLFWLSFIDHATDGAVSLIVSGNRSAGFITDVKCDGVSLGAVGAPAYNSSSDTTQFDLGSSGVANPFGTSGSRAIMVS